MTLFFTNSEISIYRYTKKAGADRYTMSATFTVFLADIQPASQERVEFVQGRIGKTFVAYLDSSIDAKEGDEIRVGTKVYSVKAVSKWQGAGLLDHVELILTSQDA
jgi:nucleoid-associated protein YejK